MKWATIRRRETLLLHISRFPALAGREFLSKLQLGSIKLQRFEDDDLTIEIQESRQTAAEG